MLGTRVLNGKGEALRFGGEVMKNVAGYDVSRLMTGAYGTLGVLLDVSLKVLPRPAAVRTLAFDMTAAGSGPALQRVGGEAVSRHRRMPRGRAPAGAARGYRGAGWRRRPTRSAAISSTTMTSGRRSASRRCRSSPGPAPRCGECRFPPGAELTSPAGGTLIDWGGALRWVRTDAPAVELRTAAERAGGHAVLFRGGNRTGDVFHPLAPAVRKLHERIKAAFDPTGIFNSGRMYEGI